MTVDGYIFNTPEQSSNPAALLRREYPLQKNSEPDLATLVLKTPTRRLKHIRRTLIYIFNSRKSIFFDFA
jgi:hypothetical protein